MISAQVQTLLAPPDSKQAEARCLELLDTHFASWDSVDRGADLAQLVDETRAQSEDLDARLSSSRASVDALLAETRESATAHIHTAQELSLLRHSLADELTDLSQDLVSSMSHGEGEPTLLEDIETLHRNLKELESVKSYVQVIQHALKLSEAAISTFRNRSGSTMSDSSLAEYRTLQVFVASVTDKCTNIAEGTGVSELHLVAFLNGVRRKTWAGIKEAVSSPLLEAAESIGWPLKVDYAASSPDDRKNFRDSFLDMLKLQELGQSLHSAASPDNQEGLYPLEALAHPIALRFKYHFDGTRQTNQLDKPEWYLTHIVNVVHEQRPFMEDIIQDLLANTAFKSIVAWREFTSLLLPIVSRKLKRSMPLLLPHPSLLAHAIYQALAFDGALGEEGFGLTGTSAAKDNENDSWEGISEVILGRKEWFDAWMEGERKFAEDQYLEIISAPDAWLIAQDADEEDGVVSELRPTNSARRVKALVEQVTDRYSPLPQFTHRTRFLINVQLPLLESYLSRISSSLDAFETLSSSFVRAVPGGLGVGTSGAGSGSDQGVLWGGDTRRLTGGVEGDQRLCKALVSAKYIASAMETWADDLFFLELWAEINRRPSLRARAEEHHLLPTPNSQEDEDPESTVFDELINQYQKVTSRAEDMAVQHVCSEIELGLRAHFAILNSITPKIPQGDDDMALASTLLPPIALLSSHLAFFKTTLPQTGTMALYRTIASRLATHILQRQIMYRGRNRIELAEGKTILAECELWLETCRTVLPGIGSRLDTPWRRLLEAARLSSLEGGVWEKVMSVTFGANGDEEWERVLEENVGISELSRDEIVQVLRARADCEV